MSSRRIAILTVCAASSLVSDAHKLVDRQVLFHKMCEELAEEPYFNIEASIDLWVNDFTWNTLEAPFELLAFRKATPGDIARFKKDMGQLVIVQPAWDTAQLIMTDQQSVRWQRRTMLFPMGNIPGRYIGVRNVRDETRLHIRRKSVQLLRYQMLMSDKDSYLTIMECDTGETSLLHRDTLRPVPANEIYSAAAMVPFPVRYSHLYTGIKTPEIRKENIFEPILLGNYDSFRPTYTTRAPKIDNSFLEQMKK